jgi:hypothetical protein
MLEYNDKIILSLKGFKSVNWFQLAKHKPSDDHFPKENENLRYIKIN